MRAVPHQVMFHNVQSDVDSQTPPVAPPSDYLAISIGYQHARPNNETAPAQDYLDSIADDLDMHYDVLHSFFQGDGTKTWKALLIKQTQKHLPHSNAPNYIIGFQGAGEPGMKLGVISSMLFGLDRELLNEINVEIKKWIKYHEIDGIHAILGHSSGSMFVKNVFGEDDLKSLKDPYMITFNGYDPLHSTGLRQLDLRSQGELFSPCMGAKDLITVCSTQPGMDAEEVHYLEAFDLDNVTWQMLDQAAGGRYKFPASQEEVGHASQCNMDILQNGDTDNSVSCTEAFGEEILLVARRLLDQVLRQLCRLYDRLVVGGGLRSRQSVRSFLFRNVFNFVNYFILDSRVFLF